MSFLTLRSESSKRYYSSVNVEDVTPKFKLIKSADANLASHGSKRNAQTSMSVRSIGYLVKESCTALTQLVAMFVAVGMDMKLL